jgi:hypothetical protein
VVIYFDRLQFTLIDGNNAGSEEEQLTPTLDIKEEVDE